MLYALFYKILAAALGTHLVVVRTEAEVKRIAELQAAQRAALDEMAQAQAAQVAALEKLLAALTPSEAVGFLFTVDVEGNIQTGVTSTTMTNSQKMTVTATPVGRNNQPAPVEGLLAWASSDETILTVVPAADGLSAEVTAVGPLGTAKVSVNGDADLGAGEKKIFGELDVEVTQGAAVGISIVAGEAVEQ